MPQSGLRVWIRRLIAGVVGVIALIGSISLLFIASIEPMENYENPNYPRFEGQYAPLNPQVGDDIKIVTWNIKFSQRIDEAITTLRDGEVLRDADILLLQEMDEVGVKTIAETLDYNFVYYPASVHTEHGRNFGNAILSKWPISNAEKLILPRQNRFNKQKRIAVRALVHIGGARVLTYSVHTETFWLGPEGRSEQVEAVAETVRPTYPYDFVIIGGDFNTVTPASIKNIEQRMATHGLVRLTKGAGYTAKTGQIRFVLDHIFGSDVPVIDKGVYRETTASDHYPLWVRLGRPETTE